MANKANSGYSNNPTKFWGRIPKFWLHVTQNKCSDRVKFQDSAPNLVFGLLVCFPVFAELVFVY